MSDSTEQEQTVEALRQSQERLARAQQIGHLGHWDWDIQEQTLLWSDEIYRIFGVDRAFPLTYETIEALIHPDDRDRNNRYVQELLAADDKIDFEFRIIRPDGDIRHIRQIAQTARDEAGQPIRAFGIMQDITERKQAEEALRQSREQLRALASHWQTVQEKERARVAREVHDEFGQSLTALKIDLAWLAKRLPPDEPVLANKVEDMIALVDNTIQIVRRVATELRPGLLDDLGLVAALEWQAQEFAGRTGIACQIDLGQAALAQALLTLDRDLATAIFRIFQEALTNIARHAAATHVQVMLQQVQDILILTVRDNGKGLPPNVAADPRALGLLGMRERALFWQGSVTFESEPGHGTTVTLRVPYLAGKEASP